ncbi:hypothetical protein J1N35_015421 [Gossypium stocksii]|uniref:Uncharacterized protein n=1 Tax=Gossypium stocksii TaxID=47602 RepID=A0A9D3VW65_9ROSI|nr:hypothetical protein J1N35_015421 [Gossypium stocksii]
MVSELIDYNDQSWKQRLIKDTFMQSDADHILQIPLVQCAHEDFLIWGGEPWGEFSCEGEDESMDHLFRQRPITVDV